MIRQKNAAIWGVVTVVGFGVIAILFIQKSFPVHFSVYKLCKIHIMKSFGTVLRPSNELECMGMVPYDIV